MKNVGVFFGSRSAEHDISIVTAINAVIEPLKLSTEFNPVPIYIAKDGRWYSEKDLADINTYISGDIESKVKKYKSLNLKFDGGLWLVKPGLGGEKIKIDVAFPATHGTYGEDGSLMGVLRMANLPFVGCDLAASAIAMDKVLCKLVVEDFGLKTPKMVFASSAEINGGYAKWADTILTKLKFPVFVKPAHLGSSIAITRVKDKKALINAIELAFHYDDKVLVEEEVDSLVEVTVPVIGNENPRTALVEESLAKDAAFFDFETKYMQGGKKKMQSASKGSYSNLPAKLPKDLYLEAQRVALEAYKAVGCTGISRVDLLIDRKKKIVYVNEINPMPGSLYEHNWKEAGLSNLDLVTELIGLAEERHAAQSKLNTVFESSFLKQF